jgi:hypothetical protein
MRVHHKETWVEHKEALKAHVTGMNLAATTDLQYPGEISPPRIGFAPPRKYSLMEKPPLLNLKRKSTQIVPINDVELQPFLLSIALEHFARFSA